MKAYDLLLDDTLDLRLEQGDLVVAPSDAQHIDLLLRTAPGHWRHDPLAGVGLLRYLQAPYGPTQAGLLHRDIAIQLERDGYEVLNLDVQDLATATINAERP